MSYRLFLDDVRLPWEVGNYINPVELRKEFRLFDWVIVRNYNSFVQTILKEGLPSHISFDHDLAEIHYNSMNYSESFEYFEETGYDCAKWLIDFCKKNNKPLPIWYVHSLNPIGADNIKNLLNKYV